MRHQVAKFFPIWEMLTFLFDQNFKIYEDFTGKTADWMQLRKKQWY